MTCPGHAELPMLERRCPRCGGSGVEPTLTADESECGRCLGEGVVPTEDGMRVLRLVARAERFPVTGEEQR